MGCNEVGFEVGYLLGGEADRRAFFDLPLELSVAFLFV